MSIKAIFYSKFDPQQGPVVVHQVPENSIITTADLSSSTSSTLPNASTPNTSSLVSFPTISRFIIPRQSLCGNLITLVPPPLSHSHPPLLILSYPQCLTSPRYHRNEFIFTFTLILASTPSLDTPSYTSVITKLASLMSSLEEQSQFLSLDPSPPQTGPIYSLLETLLMDLNNYAECMTPLHPTANTLNIKLFPTLPPPPKIASWHVPLFTVHITTLLDANWDLTLQRIIPYINGINSVRRISILADADTKLVRKAIRHLVYYGCALLLDIFSFSAIYAPTNESHLIVGDKGMQRECARYVNTRFAPTNTHGHVGDGEGEEVAVESPRIAAQQARTHVDEGQGEEEDVWPLTSKGEVVDGVTIVQLYANLRQGLTVRGWYALNSDLLANIDIRRFITFGVIKGLIYRVHRYAVRTKVGMVSKNGERNRDALRGSIVDQSGVGDDEEKKEAGKGSKRGERRREETTDEDEKQINARIAELIDGTHCFDEICTELEISEKELTRRLHSGVFGEVSIICR